MVENFIGLFAVIAGIASLTGVSIMSFINLKMKLKKATEELEKIKKTERCLRKIIKDSILGFDYFLNDKPELALKLFIKILKKNDSMEKVVAKIYERMGNIDKALFHIDRLIEKNNSDIYFNYRGNLYYKIGDIKKAKSNYLNALKIKYDNEESLTALGNLYLNIKEYKLAKNIYNSLCKYYPENNEYKQKIEEINKLIEDNEIKIERNSENENINDIQSDGKFLPYSGCLYHFHEIDGIKIPSNDIKMRNYAFELCIKNAINNSLEINLSCTFLNDVKYQNIQLYQANFEAANLSNADFRYGSFIKTNFQKADLTQVNLHHTKLTGSNFNHACLNNANLSNTYAVGVKFENALLRQINLKEANLGKSVFTNSNLMGAHLDEANLQKSQLRYVNLYGGFLREADLNNADITGIDLGKADITNAIITYKQLITAKSLFQCKGIKQEIEEKLQNEYPLLFME